MQFHPESGHDAGRKENDRKFYKHVWKNLTEARNRTGGTAMIKEAILKLAKKEDLTYEEAEAVMNEIMGGEATPVQMSSYLTALCHERRDHR